MILKWGKVPAESSRNPRGHGILQLNERQAPFQEQVLENNWSTSAKLALPDHKGKCFFVGESVREEGGGRHADRVAWYRGTLWGQDKVSSMAFHTWEGVLKLKTAQSRGIKAQRVHY